MKILLFGKNGQVGWELQRSLAPLGELVAPARSDAPLCGDLSDLDGIVRTVREVRPELIVNAAAYTAVDKAESEPDLCRRINAEAPAALAVQAQKLGAWLIHYSSDYVFDGSGDLARKEDEPMAPLNAYGRSKAEGERLVAAACAQHLLLRTSWVYAARGANFARTMLRLGAERDRITVVDDQHGAPTGAELIADVTAHAIRAALRGDPVAGTYHLVPAGQTSWFGYARFLLGEASAMGWPVKAQLEPVPSSAYPTPAPRPHNSRLNNKKLEKTFGLRLPPWQDGVRRMLAASRPS